MVYTHYWILKERWQNLQPFLLLWKGFLKPHVLLPSVWHLLRTMLEHFLKWFFSILQVSNKSREKSAMSASCPGKDHKLQGPRDLNMRSWFNPSMAVWPWAGYLTSLNLNFLIYKIRVMIVASSFSSISLPEGSHCPLWFHITYYVDPEDTHIPTCSPALSPVLLNYISAHFADNFTEMSPRHLKYIIYLARSMCPGSYCLMKSQESFHRLLPLYGALIFPPALACPVYFLWFSLISSSKEISWTFQTKLEASTRCPNSPFCSS